MPDSGRGYMSKIFNDEWMIANGFLEDQQAKATVGDVLRSKSPLPPMIAIGEDDVVKHALDLMRTHEISQLPVMRGDRGRRQRQRRRGDAGRFRPRRSDSQAGQRGDGPRLPDARRRAPKSTTPTSC